MIKSFPMVPIGEVAYSVKRPEVPLPGTVYRQVGVHLWGEGAYERESIDGGETRYSTLYCVESGDIIVNKIWARNGSVAVVNGGLAGCFCSAEFPIYAPDRNRIEPRWFHWITKTSWFWYECDLKSRGTIGKNRIRPEKFLEIQIPLPPLKEQQRIVAKIDELAAKIDEARWLRQRSVVEIETLISSASKYFFSAEDLEHLTRLEVLTTRITKGESPEWQGFTYQDSGAFFVRSENVLWGKFDKSKQVHIPVEFHEKLGRSQLCAGDVLINLVGASIGRSCVVPDDLGKANVNQAVAVISPDQKQLDSKFLMHFLISEPAQKTIHGGKVETARPNISLTDLRNLMIPVYSLNEQLRIVTYLDGLQGKVDAVKNVRDHTAAELDALLPSILDKAFKGEL